MSCCIPPTAYASDDDAAHIEAVQHELLLASRLVSEGKRQIDLSVPGIHCGDCIRKIEAALGRLEGVTRARVNLSTKRVSVQWAADLAPPPMIETLAALGYEANVPTCEGEQKDQVFTDLLWALAVAAFASMNIMFLSVSVWSGAAPATRDLFHWMAAGIALPALIYSGRIFFASAWNALRRGQTNMDVPISIGVLLAFGMSVFETINHGQHAYYDAAVSLLFFLLIGRTLDHMMRQRARVAVNGLARLSARGALVQRVDGSREYTPVGEIEPGMTILLAVGERVPVDCRVESGVSEIDYSLVNGESTPRRVAIGSIMEAGTLNLLSPLTVTATAAAKDSFLAEMVRLMEVAEQGRSHYRRIADRASSLYAPVIHTTAFLSFLGWAGATGDLHHAITIAVAVLIITCPCALGLAVPMVQVVAARRLFESGIMVKDGSAMERLAEIDTVLFDKTGTLTLGKARLADPDAIHPEHLKMASSLAAHSRHPYSVALQGLATGAVTFDSIAEFAGMGLEGRIGDRTYRLGRAEWALDSTLCREVNDDAGTVLSLNGRRLASFRFEDPVRPGAAETIVELTSNGLSAEIVSGDMGTAVHALARAVGISDVAAELHPADKVARVTALAEAGCKVLMVGDGLNDAPALVAAHVSMAPATAADIGRNAADFVFLRENLSAVTTALAIARVSGKLIRQNLWLAILYNAIALPLAIFGYVTPLVAALAMSLSSVLVVANSLRLSAPSAARNRLRSAPAMPAVVPVVELAR